LDELFALDNIINKTTTEICNLRMRHFETAQSILQIAQIDKSRGTQLSIRPPKFFLVHKQKNVPCHRGRFPDRNGNNDPYLVSFVA